MSIAVLGSINMDLVAHTARLPVSGETLTGQTFHTYPGGKGANQAVACARLGAPTVMIGRVGDDVFGSSLKDQLASAGVDHSNVEVTAEVSSGVALIAVEDSAENFIIVVPGANGLVGEDDLHKLEAVLDRSKLLLLQLEIPLATVIAAAKLARAKGVTVILDPAPAQALPEELYALVDILTPNETEAGLLTELAVNSQADAARAAQILCDRGVSCVLVKMGSRGALARIDGHETFYPSYPVTAVDTVAAGDAFNGALAVALSEGQSIDEAIRWGLAGGAISVTRAGAQPAMPDRNELLSLLEHYQH